LALARAVAAPLTCWSATGEKKADDRDLLESSPPPIITDRMT